MAIIFHITTKPEWEAAQPIGEYASASLAAEGFNHCCTAEQVPGVLERYFKGKKNLVKLHIDSSKLRSQLVYDWSPSVQDTFPHIYGPVNTDAVVQVDDIDA